VGVAMVGLLGLENLAVVLVVAFGYDGCAGVVGGVTWAGGSRTFLKSIPPDTGLCSSCAILMMPPLSWSESLSPSSSVAPRTQPTDQPTNQPTSQNKQNKPPTKKDTNTPIDQHFQC
jgi:hypothetical protein